MLKISRFLTDPDYRFLVKESRGMCDNMSDEEFLRRKFKAKVGYELNLDDPKTFNEKLQWLKLHDRNPLYTRLVDKIAVKEWVSERIGDEYIIPTLAVWDGVEDIDIDSLPDRFVLKTNHDSGGIVICRDRESFDLMAAKCKLEKSLKRNYYFTCREWPYKDVKPKVFAEAYLEDLAAGELPDYKFMCFDGKAHCSFTCTGRAEGDLRVDFFDREWNHLSFTRHYPNADAVPGKPDNFLELQTLAERLSEGFPFVRVDFYDIGGKGYFGEMTFYPGAGFEEFDPESWDLELGSWIKLPAMLGGGGCLVSANWVLWLHEGSEIGAAVREGLVVDGRGEESLADYKLFRFAEGEVITLVCEERQLGPQMRKTFFDEDWNAMPFSEGGHPVNPGHPRPVHFDEMLEITRELGRGMPFVRCDYYDSGDWLYFGEMTFYPNAGYERFEPPEWDNRLGDMIDLGYAYEPTTAMR